MRATINNTLIKTLKPTDKAYDVRDIKLTGFMIRVSSGGTQSYVCQFKRGKRVTIGKVGVITPAQARDRAKEILGDTIKGIDPNTAKELERKQMSLKVFIEQEYQPWIIVHRKVGQHTLARIQRCFYQGFADLPLNKITIQAVEKWRTQRINQGRTKKTANLDIAALKAALTKAMEWEIIDVHPLGKLKLLKIDWSSKVRFLSTEEEQQLRQLLDERENKIKKARDNANVWRKERGYQIYPHIDQNQFADHLKPMVLLSMNTGIRQGELFNLTWANINFVQAILIITGDKAKSGKTRYIPLNSEALMTLKTWYQQTENEGGLVFPSKTSNPFNNVRKAWQRVLKLANISDFRWHDLRHHFASKLVMASVDLNTVRELLGHSDIKMTLRYAHLAPGHKANAVEKLVGMVA